MAGAYIVWFWGTEIASGATALSGSGPFQFVENLSQIVLNVVADHTEVVAGGFGLLIAGAAAIAWLTRSARASDSDDDTTDAGADEVEVAHAGAGES